MNTPNLPKKALLVLLYPWIVWALGSSFMFYKNILGVAPSVMNTDLMTTFMIAGAATGNLVAFYFYSYTCMQIPTGMILDRFGTRNIITVAILVCALGAYLFGSAQVLSEAQLGRFLMGLGAAFSAVGTMKLITLWFQPSRFALVSGLMLTVAMLGLMSGKAPVAYAVLHYGWRQTMYMTAVLGVVYAIVFWAVVRDHAPQGMDKEDSQLPFWQSMRSILRNPQSWLISLYSGISYAPIDAFGQWGDDFLIKAYGVSKLTASGMVSMIYVGLALGAPLAGWFSDYIKRRKVTMSLGTLLATLSIMAVFYLTSMPTIMIYVCLLLFGFFIGGYFVSFAVMREINHPQVAGTAVGFTNTFNALASAISIPLIGKILDVSSKGLIVDNLPVFSANNYQVALTTIPITLALSLLVLIFVRETHCRHTHNV